MKIKHKLLITFGLVNIIIFIIVTTITVITTNKAMMASLNGSLQGSTTSVVNTVKNLLDETSKSFLTINSKATENMIKSLDRALPTQQAKADVLDYINSSSLFGSGFSYIIDNNSTKLIGKSSKFDKQINNKSHVGLKYKDLYLKYGYFDYSKDHSLYMIFTYEPWDWTIVSVVKTKDALELVTPKSFSEKISAMKIGKNGYPYILNSKGVLITHPTSIGKNMYNATDVDGNKIFKEIIESKSGYLQYRWENRDNTIDEMFARYMPIDNTDWIVVSGGLKSDFFQIVDSIKSVLLYTSILAVLINLIITFIVSSILTRPISNFTYIIKDLSEGEGDLTSVVKAESNDEIGEIAHYLNNFILKLRNIILDIKNSANETLEIKDELSSGTLQTSAALHQISKNIITMEERIHGLGFNVDSSHNSVENIAGNINELNNLIDNQSSLIEESTAAITQMTTSISSVANITEQKRLTSQKLIITAGEGRDIILKTNKAVSSIKEELHSVRDMANLITDIASRTDLLSMNAAIEAAHAGEAGKGFAVVADEIRKLAESSSINSSNIQEILMKTEKAMEETEVLSRESGIKFNHIDNEITLMVDAFNTIDTRTHELHAGGSELLEAIKHLQNSSLTVKENSVIINSDASNVQDQMLSTRKTTEEVINSIQEINIGASEISNSMSQVTDNTHKIGKTGTILHGHVNKFVC